MWIGTEGSYMWIGTERQKQHYYKPRQYAHIYTSLKWYLEDVLLDPGI
jgi:hypothetical protein